MDERPRAPLVRLARHERMTSPRRRRRGVLAHPRPPPSLPRRPPNGTPNGTSNGTPKSPARPGRLPPAVATTLRVAAGLCKHCAGGYSSLPTTFRERPTSCSRRADVMRLVCLAEAQAATARRAEERGTAASLVAKLHLGAWNSSRRRISGSAAWRLQPNRPETEGVRVARHLHPPRQNVPVAAEEAWAETDVGRQSRCARGINTRAPRRRNRPGGETRGTRSTAMGNAERVVTENEVVFFEKVPERRGETAGGR